MARKITHNLLNIILLTIGLIINQGYAFAQTELKENLNPSGVISLPPPRPRSNVDHTPRKPAHIGEPQRPSMVVDTATVFDTTRTAIILEQADLIRFDNDEMPNVQVLTGSVRLRQDNALLFCDSAYLNQDENSFIAFGNVRIMQGDTLSIHARKLDYNGNTRIARLKYKVRMKNRQVTLTTDSLTYNRNTSIGYYTCGGILNDSLNTLVSQKGYYNTETKIAEFKQDVVGTNENDTIISDTLIYNTSSKVATIVGPTTILHNNETTIYSEYGWYNTELERSELLKNSVITQNDGKTLSGDTIFYDSAASIGKAYTNVVMTDTANQLILFGNYGFYQRENEISIVTDSALMRRYDDDNDTTYVHADTLYSYALDPGSMVLAYHNARIYNADYQAVCDSMVFFTGDSIMRLYQLPVLWNEEKQISADSIIIYPDSADAYHVEAVQNAIIVIELAPDDTLHYHQMSGKKIVGFIDNQNLTRIEIQGNAISNIFPQEDDGYIIGLNKIESSYMTIFFDDGKIERMTAFPSPKATMLPPPQIAKNQLFLSDFSWQTAVRPNAPYDVYRHPQRTSKEQIEKQKQEIKQQEQEERKHERKKNRNKKTDSEKLEEPTTSTDQMSNSLTAPRF